MHFGPVPGPPSEVAMQLNLRIQRVVWCINLVHSYGSGLLSRESSVRDHGLGRPHAPIRNGNQIRNRPKSPRRGVGCIVIVLRYDVVW